MTRKAVSYVLSALAVGILLSGCASITSDSSGCVGPPDFCQPYFGS